MRNRSSQVRGVCVALIVSLVWSNVARAQVYGGVYKPSTMTAATAPTTSPAPAAAPLKPEELEQIAAPIALYPDSLLAQVLMASTYPLEVVQAERWAKQNPSLKDKALADALNAQTWDASVKSLVNFPQVLTMMSEKLDWTMKLGDAFIADQKSVMDAVQRLRGKAQAQGNLKSTNEQVVKVDKVAATATQPASQVIIVESASPSVVYVPTYNPTVVYGAWPYPSYPPSYYYPPGYVAGTALISFGVGMAVGAAWGHAWGGCNWHGGDVDIDVNRNTNINTNIDRDAARANMDARQGDRDTRQTDRQGNRDTRQTNRQGGTSGGSKFQHDPSHRKGVAYRDSATNEKFRGANQASAQARDSYRGRAEAGRQDLSRGGGSSFSGRSDSFSGGTGGSYSRQGGSASPSRDSSGTRSSGLSGAGSSGNSTRAASNRGQSSRSSSGYSGSRSGGGSSGGSRSAGGSRGGGGGGRGGGRR